MAASSITRSFVVKSEEQAQMFADAIEESYQKSLVRKEENLANFHYIRSFNEFEQFMKRWRAKHKNDK